MEIEGQNEEMEDKHSILGLAVEIFKVCPLPAGHSLKEIELQRCAKISNLLSKSNEDIGTHI